MKVKIGKYLKYWGPYQIAEALLFWIPKYNKDHRPNPAYDKYVHRFGEWLADTKLYDLCVWVHAKRKRTVKIQIHNYDAWSARTTMAMIILPVLQEVKKHGEGAAFVDDEDVPWYLRSTIYTKENEWDSDPSWGKRWEWVLDEMIWTFSQLVDEDWESRYHHGEIDILFEPCVEEAPMMYELKTGPRDTSWWDKEGEDNHNRCIENGLRLYGKYFRSLWT